MESDERSGSRQRCGGCQNAAAGCLHLREARVRWSMRAMELGSKGAPGVGADGSARRELELLGGRGGDLCVHEAVGWRTRARGDTRAGQIVGSERRGCLGPRGRGCDLWECEELGGGQRGERSRNGTRVHGEQECTQARAGPESRGGVRARERKIVVGRLGQQRAPGRLRRARSAGAAVSCLGGVREVVEEWGDVMVEAGCACWRARVLARRSAG